MVLEDLFLLLHIFTHPPYFYPSIFVFTHPNDGWMGLYIKVWLTGKSYSTEKRDIIVNVIKYLAIYKVM